MQTRYFFLKKVMVMDKNKSKRENRLALLAALEELMNRIINLSELKIEKIKQKKLKMKIVVIDRDGVVNEDSEYYIKDPDEWIPIPVASKLSLN